MRMLPITFDLICYNHHMVLTPYREIVVCERTHTSIYSSVAVYRERDEKEECETDFVVFSGRDEEGV